MACWRPSSALSERHGPLENGDPSPLGALALLPPLSRAPSPYFLPVPPRWQVPFMSTPAHTQEEVVKLMESSKSETEWNANCDAVKQANGGYPAFWYEAILLSGLCARVRATWG